MTKLLPILLEAEQHAGSERKKELAKKIDPKLHFEMGDGTTKSVRELLLSDSNSTTTLIQAEVYATVVEGAQPVRQMRNLVDIVQMNSNTMRVNYGGAAAYAAEVDEATEIPIAVQTYTPITFTAKKYGARPLITRELVNDGLFDVIAEEIKYAGAKLENRLNAVALDEFLLYSGNEFDTAGSNQGIKGVAKAIGVQKEAGFMPTDLIMHPEAEAIVLCDYTPTGAYYQVGNATTTGILPAPILGMNAGGCGVTYSGGTYTWGYAADTEIGMLLLDRNRGGKIGMREDIRVEKYDDPVKDLVGISCTMRTCAKAINTTAITRVEY